MTVMDKLDSKAAEEWTARIAAEPSKALEELRDGRLSEPRAVCLYAPKGFDEDDSDEDERPEPEPVKERFNSPEEELAWRAEGWLRECEFHAVYILAALSFVKPAELKSLRFKLERCQFAVDSRLVDPDGFDAINERYEAIKKALRGKL